MTAARSEPVTTRNVQQLESVLSSMENKAKYVAGGVAGIALIGTAGLPTEYFKTAPTALGPLFMTLILAAAGLLALAYVGFRSDGKALTAMRLRDSLNDTSPAPQCLNQFGFKSFVYACGLWFLIASGVVLAMACWWGAYQC